jgi:hypothetical protein
MWTSLLREDHPSTQPINRRSLSIREDHLSAKTIYPRRPSIHEDHPFMQTSPPNEECLSTGTSFRHRDNRSPEIARLLMYTDFPSTRKPSIFGGSLLDNPITQASPLWRSLDHPCMQSTSPRRQLRRRKLYYKVGWEDYPCRKTLGSPQAILPTP